MRQDKVGKNVKAQESSNYLSHSSPEEVARWHALLNLFTSYRPKPVKFLLCMHYIVSGLDKAQVCRATKWMVVRDAKTNHD